MENFLAVLVGAAVGAGLTGFYQHWTALRDGRRVLYSRFLGEVDYALDAASRYTMNLEWPTPAGLLLKPEKDLPLYPVDRLRRSIGEDGSRGRVDGTASTDYVQTTSNNDLIVYCSGRL